jgi:hypothetical protein
VDFGISDPEQFEGEVIQDDPPGHSRPGGSPKQRRDGAKSVL